MNTPFQLGPSPRLEPNLAATLPATGARSWPFRLAKAPAGAAGARCRRPWPAAFVHRGWRWRRFGTFGSSASIASAGFGVAGLMVPDLVLLALARRWRSASAAGFGQRAGVGFRLGLGGRLGGGQLFLAFLLGGGGGGLLGDQLVQLVDQPGHALLVALEVARFLALGHQFLRQGGQQGGAARLLLLQLGFLLQLFLRDFFQLVLGVLRLGLVDLDGLQVGAQRSSRRACACET
jgi:hypothetical protein